MSINETQCACDPCPGAECVCGCQKAQPEGKGGCKCGESCACGTNCSCEGSQA